MRQLAVLFSLYLFDHELFDALLTKIVYNLNKMKS